MTEQDTYISGQKASGIEVGDTVRVTRPNAAHEGGSDACWHTQSELDLYQDDEGFVVISIRSRAIDIQNKRLKASGQLFHIPYFVLEIVKKANGSKPECELSGLSATCVVLDEFAEISNTITGESNMKEQKVFDVTIVERTEELHEGSGVVKAVNRTVLFDKKVSAVTDEAAKQKALSECNTQNFDDLEITCNPFCSE